jgi:predicted nuclease of predicted toxin-antitoxin system
LITAATSSCCSIRISASSFAKPSLIFSRNPISLGCWDYRKSAIWCYGTTTNGFAIVSLDVDFAEMAARLGSPPKVIWLRGGNRSTAAISALLRRYAEIIVSFGSDNETACLEIY